MARLLLSANATVTVCHSRTRDLAATCRRADVLVAAVGVPRLLGADAVKPGAVVIDVGMNRLEDGLVGDVDFEAAREVAAAITPVPGGVGPMTIAMLLVNTVQAARRRGFVGRLAAPDERARSAPGPHRRAEAPSERPSWRRVLRAASRSPPSLGLLFLFMFFGWYGSEWLPGSLTRARGTLGRRRLDLAGG